MFNHIRNRLLLSYLGVIAAILGLFAISVRVTFVRSLNQQLNSRLATLAQSAMLELEYEDGEVTVDLEDITSETQAVQWFDAEGNLLGTQGRYVVHLPIMPSQSIQTQRQPYPAKALTLPVRDLSKDIFLGYTRVSESTVSLNTTLQILDMGLGGGVLAALALSGLGGLWLTRQAMHPIEQSFRRLQQFTGDASHELRSPLMAIQANAAVALKYPDNMRPADAEKFQAIQSASAQMKALTEDLLLLARTERASAVELAVEKNPLNLTSLLEEIYQQYLPQANSQKVNLTVNLATDLWLLGHPVQLTRLLTNLLDNALRYTPSGGSVDIMAQRQRDKLLVSIQDTGIGIASEQLESIFERFWQADKARSYTTGGAGLGLAIAQEIARSHGGKITVASELGKGSCFTVELSSIQKPQR